MFLVYAADLNPGGIIAWLVVGLIAGWAASKLMGAGGYGLVGDVIVGLIGAFLGGIIVNLVIKDANFSLLGSIIVSILGACVLIAILRAVSPKRAI